MGLESPTFPKTSEDKDLMVEQEEKVVEAQNEVNKQQPADEDGEAETNQDSSEPGKGLGGENKDSLWCFCFWQINQFNVVLGISRRPSVARGFGVLFTVCESLCP